MPVVVLLMDHGDPLGGVDQGPPAAASFEEHPVVPAGASDGEIGDGLEASARKDEVVTSRRRVEAAAHVGEVTQAILPSRSGGEILLDLQIPTASHEQELWKGLRHFVRCRDQVLEK